MKRTRILPRAISVFAAAALIGFMSISCGGSGSPADNGNGNNNGPLPPVYHTVTFNTGGGTPVPSQQVLHGQTATRPADPTREGYYFHGWYADEGFNTPFSFDTPITAPRTLFAQWGSDPPAFFTVTFNANDGTPAPGQQTVQSGHFATEPEITRTGWSFAGWSTSPTHLVPFDFETMPITSDMTLHAMWQQILHTVTFDTGDGSTIAPRNVQDGQTTAPPPNPTRPGYTFDGWFTDAAHTIPFTFDTPITAPITLFARWVEASTHTVTFYTGSGTAIPPASVQAGQTVPAPPAPTRAFAFTPAPGLWRGHPDAYTFTGWHGPGGTPWNFATGTVTADITLTAQWQAPAPVPGVPLNNVAAAVAYVNANPGVFTLFLSGNSSSNAAHTLNVAGVDLTIIGLGGRRLIYRSNNGVYFTVSGTGVSLTIGDNITLRGRTAGVAGATNNNATVINLTGAGAHFVMLDGSLITGNTKGAATIGTAVQLGSNTTFTMRGGEISGNRNTNQAAANTLNTGGVAVNENATFIMEGGRITGNNVGNSDILRDVYVAHNATGFSLSGAAEIGVLTLNATSATVFRPVTIEAGWTGAVETLNLRGTNSNVTTVANWWTNNQVLTGSGVNATTVGQFTLGEFISNASWENLELISQTHTLGPNGHLLQSN
ncbi:MAG: InlB B-repeat-containing protein [Treponema sp.]|nr:InlB B-repeat-containing protein [Treponema sp.]